MLDFFNYMITNFGVPLFFIGLAIILYISWLIGWKHGDELLGIAPKEKNTDDEIKKAIHRADAKRRLKYTKENEKRANAS